MSRITTEISKLVNEILDLIPQEYWQSTTTTFLDPSIGGGQFVREIERRLREHNHSDDNIHKRVFGFETTKLYVNHAVNRHKLVGNYSVMTCSKFLEYTDKTFDIVVGGPLFSHRVNGSSADIDSQYCNKAMDIGHNVFMVVRSKHFGSHKSAFRRRVFESRRLATLSHIPKIHYPNTLNIRTCLINICKEETTTTAIKFADGNVYTTKLDKDSVIMLHDSNYIGEVKNNLAHRFVIGKLRRKNIVDVKNGIPIIEVMGSEENPITRYVDPTSTDIGINMHGVIMNSSVGWGDLGRIFIKPYEATISGSVVCLRTDTLDEAKVLKEYLETDSVRNIIRKSMVSFHPTKALFSCIADPLI